MPFDPFRNHLIDIGLITKPRYLNKLKLYSLRIIMIFFFLDNDYEKSAVNFYIYIYILFSYFNFSFFNLGIRRILPCLLFGNYFSGMFSRKFIYYILELTPFIHSRLFNYIQDFKSSNFSFTT